MSTGHGKLQNEILKYIVPPPIYLNELRWKLAHANCQRISHDGKITKSFLENFRRAIKNLIEDQTILLEYRTYKTFEEIRLYYPYFSTDNRVLNLRKELLPYIDTLIQGSKGSKITLAEQENRQIDILIDTKRDVFSKLKTDWNKLRTDTISFLNVDKPVNIHIWLQLLTRGELLFNTSKRSPQESLIFYTNLLRNTQTTKDSVLISNIQNFIDEYFDHEEIKIGKIKGILYSHVVDFSWSSGKAKLLNKAKKYLLENKRDIIINLPGHIEPKTPNDINSWLDFLDVDSRQFSPFLDLLIKRDIFQKHRFVCISSQKI